MAQSGELDRRLTRLPHEPRTVRVGASAIVSGSAIVVIGAGIPIRVVDHDGTLAHVDARFDELERLERALNR